MISIVCVLIKGVWCYAVMYRKAFLWYPYLSSSVRFYCPNEREMVVVRFRPALAGVTKVVVRCVYVCDSDNLPSIGRFVVL